MTFSYFFAAENKFSKFSIYFYLGGNKGGPIEPQPTPADKFNFLYKNRKNFRVIKGNFCPNGKLNYLGLRCLGEHNSLVRLVVVGGWVHSWILEICWLSMFIFGMTIWSPDLRCKVGFPEAIRWVLRGIESYLQR